MSRSATLRQAALLFLLLALAACTAPPPVDRGDYLGHWRAEGVSLVIQANGQAHWERVKDGRRNAIDAPAHSFTTQGFKIGVGPFSATFKVDSPPTQVDGRWRMTVDGVVLTRTDPGDALQKSQPTIQL